MFVLQMSLAVCLSGEAEAAYLALERFLPRVSPHVPGEGALVIAGVGAGAHVTSVRGLAQVLLIVALQSSQVGKDCGTKTAGKLSLQLHFFDDRIVVKGRIFLQAHFLW